MKNRRFIINAFLLIATLIVITASVFGQSNEILVTGNPPFTQSHFDSIVKYYERGLNIEFSQNERRALKSQISAAWRKFQKSNPNDLLGFMKTVEKINSLGDEKIKNHQDEFTEALLGDLKTMRLNGWSDLVIEVYENSRRIDSTSNAQLTDETPTQTENSDKTETVESQTDGEPNFQPIEGSIKLSDLVGKWNKGTVASYGYRNSVTNDYRSGYGSANQHDIYAGGNFDYSNFAQVSSYGCTTELFTSMKGRASISGSQITFTYNSGTVNIKDSCKKSSVDKPAQIRKTTYRIERNGARLRLCEIGTETPSCLYKEEK